MNFQRKCKNLLQPCVQYRPVIISNKSNIFTKIPASPYRCHNESSRCLSTEVWKRESNQFVDKQQHTNSLRPEWNKVVADAEKIVGYPTSFLSLRWLLSDEIANVALHLRKLVGSNHPLLKTAKHLLYNNTNNMQAWGLIVLLMSKTVGYAKDIDVLDQDKSAGVLHSQRALAEVTEMMRTSHLIHKGLINIYPGLFTQPEVLNDMTFGNKIALLSGDYLLSNSCAELAALKNQHLVELMSSAVRDFAEGEFYGSHDHQNNPLPPKHLGQHTKIDSINLVKTLISNKSRSLENKLSQFETLIHESEAMKDWTNRNLLLGASLLGKACQGACLLAGQDAHVQHLGYKFGTHLALGWQAFLELEQFVHYQNSSNQFDANSSSSSSKAITSATFNLASIPILFHLEYSGEHELLYKEIEKGLESVLNVSELRVYQHVNQGPGLKLTKLLLNYHSSQASHVLLHFDQSDAKNALTNIIKLMKNY